MKRSATLAIIGMAGRFPGARNITEFWQNLSDGVESIADRSDADLVAAGATPEELADPDYVKRASMLDDVPLFDAAFFGLSPKDAAIMDPQHRHFLECAWEALEDAGHPPQKFDGSVGIFAGSGMNTYLIHNLLANRRLLESAGLFQLKQTGNDKDVLATRVSYQLDLRGPSVNVQTACSTSLVAVHLACQSLLNYECDMALAGGVTIEIPHGLGYIFRPGEILSRDGHCRSFDAASSGTVFGSGLGIVVLRRLEDALEDRDHIRAVILASAINNDGARKVGYLAPSVEGQAEVIAEALDVAGVSADEISYVETHGTGTVVGDPIEVRALSQAFRKSTFRIGYCGIGSLKSNVGHLDAAAGIGGLIKTVLALEHGQLPPSLNFQNLNPHIELKDSPFFVNNKLTSWLSNGSPRRAGVTALGIGGTNAHVVLGEAPTSPISRRAASHQLLTISAKTVAAADRAVANLAAHLHTHPEINLAEVAFTCQQGRHAFPHRRALVVEDTPEGIAAFAAGERKSIIAGTAGATAPQFVFMFSGQGSQYVHMGRDLYKHQPVFRETLDRCAQFLQQSLGIDLLRELYPPDPSKDAAAETLNQTWLTQPALFSVEYALARWWMSLGVNPAAMVGHSIGEYVAACLAGVLSLDDALDLVAFRGRLIYELPRGSMLTVQLAAAELHLNGTLSLAAVNNPGLCVVSGPTPDIAAFEESLTRQSVGTRRLLTSHAFHSAMMDPILERFENRISKIPLQPPRIPYLSNVSGTWIKPEEATDPAYWARHIRRTVRFSDCLAELLRQPGHVFVEVGPGNALTSLARQQGGASARAFQSLPHPRENVSGLHCALSTLGQIWVSGAEVQWPHLHAPGSVQRVPLPTYPFEHEKFWIEPDTIHATAASPGPIAQPAENQEPSFYRRVWRPAPVTPAAITEPGCWVVFRDSLGLSDRIASKLKSSKQDIIEVCPGTCYRHDKKNRFTIRPGVREDYDSLIADLTGSGHAFTKIIHLWSVTADAASPALEETLDRSFYSPLYLAQALAAHDLSGIDIALISNRLQQVSSEPVRNPARAVLLGPARVVPKELPGITCRALDVDLETGPAGECVAQIIAEMASVRENATIAVRRGVRFVEVLEHLDLSTAPESPRLQRGGVYLITGGLGAIGLIIAEHLARNFNARLVLISRSKLPPEAQWEASLNGAPQADATQQRVRKLMQIRSLAAGLLVAQGDVTRLDQMRSIVDLTRRKFGKIDGVFHAAGVLDDGPLMLKTAQAAARVLDPKVRGTLVLEEALSDAPPEFFVLFSSISSIFPPAGQVDYAAANAFLDAFAISRNGSVTDVNWGAWRESGMAARSGFTHPLLQRRRLETSREIVFDNQLSPEKQWLLSEHKLKTGKALIPGTGFLEMAAEAFTRGPFRGAIEFESVFFVAPLTFDASETRDVRVHLRREQITGAVKGSFRFGILARDGKADTGGWVEHSNGLITSLPASPTSPIDRASIAARCLQRDIIFDAQHRTRQERYFDFGPRWHCLRRLRIGDREGLAELALDEELRSDASAFLLHPALLDLATGCSLYLIEGYDSSDDLYLPFSYKKISVHRSIPARCFSHMRSRNENSLHGEMMTFDLTLFDEQNQLVLEIEGFSMRRIDDPAKANEEKLRSADPDSSRAAQPIGAVIPPEISPSDGARALTRLLMVKTPPAVVVTSQPLDDLETRTSVPPSPPIVAAAPGESVEDTLATWWQDLLGVEQVGFDDDFFALGGHSLIGVRMFAKVKKSYQVDLELSVLFEARTIRQLAAQIHKARHAEVAEPKAWSALVPIQPHGSRIPLFCIHAIGGDVLFYEPLAEALGLDQPLFAFKSPLISQAEVQQTSLEELASIYVKELRAFYPQGPYLLAGASLGGLVAFEMAQQLYAQGIQPGLVVLIDTSVPGSAKIVNVQDRMTTLWQNLRQDGITYLARKAVTKREYWEKTWTERASRAACACFHIAHRPLPHRLHLYQVEEAHSRALMHYTCRPYPGEITLMRAADHGEILSKREDPTLGWGSFASGGLQVLDVPSGHISMLFHPFVSSFAEILRTILPS